MQPLGREREESYEERNHLNGPTYLGDYSNAAPAIRTCNQTAVIDSTVIDSIR